jgi:hypothetical protein
MKTGDKVIRKWKPSLGEGKVVHILGDKIVVQWMPNGNPKMNIEDKKYLKLINESG